MFSNLSFVLALERELRGERQGKEVDKEIEVAQTWDSCVVVYATCCVHGVGHAGFDASFSASGWLLPPFFFVKFIITSVKVNSSFI